MLELGFFKPFDKSTFTFNQCFLCGLELDVDNRTDEHIFPKWLQKKYSLWNQSLRVLNRTLIHYRYLTIPCCKECNGVHLSKMEMRFQSLLEAKFENLTRDDEQIIFQWTSKLLYGTMFKELSLNFDRSNPALGKILPLEFVESYEAMHLFLQSIRIPTDFVDPKPWSIFIFNYEGDGFDYINNITALGVSLKFGEIGVSIVFQDNNCVELFLTKLKTLQDFNLNHVQFLEVSARIFYGKLLADNVPKYIHVFNTEDKFMHIVTLGNLTSREWDDEEFAAYLEYIIRQRNIEVGLPIMNEDKMFTTYLVDKDGVKFLDKINKKLREGASE